VVDLRERRGSMWTQPGRRWMLHVLREKLVEQKAHAGSVRIVIEMGLVAI
jgi:hypothetical protein